MDTKGGKPWGGGDGGVMNWAIGFDMYTLMCIKLMTNKNLRYKKINKIKFKNSKKKKKRHIFVFTPLPSAADTLSSWAPTRGQWFSGGWRMDGA